MAGANNDLIAAKGIIHLVDDERDIVRIATSALKNNGYQVHSFTSGSEAIADIEANCKDEITLLITDIRMPGISGFEMIRRVLAFRPDLPIIFMTAFEMNRNEFGKMFPSLKVEEFLQKPFHTRELLDAVERTLTHSSDKLP